MDTLDKCIDIVEIMKVLQHRYPMLLIDKVLQISPPSSIVALKNVSINEQFFNGHFPNNPVMPGVLLVEAIAQAAGFLTISSFIKQSESTNIDSFAYYFMSISSAKFRKPVVPGDSLHIHVNCLNSFRNVQKYAGKIFVDNKVVAEAVISGILNNK